MAKYHGKSVYFTVADSDGTARKISCDLASVSLNRDAPTADVTGFCGNDTTAVIGMRSYNIALDGFWSDTGSTGTYTVLNGILGASTTWELGPAGSGTGMVKLSGSGFCTAFNTTGAVGAALGMSATIQGTGAISASTY